MREFMIGVLLIPLIIGIVCSSAFGEAAISQFESGEGALSGGITDASLTLFQLLDGLPIS